MNNNFNNNKFMKTNPTYEMIKYNLSFKMKLKTKVQLKILKIQFFNL